MADSRPVERPRRFALSRAVAVRTRSLRGFTMSQTWAIVLPVLLAAFLLGGQVGFVDLGYHLRAGELSVTQGHWIDQDVFTSTFAGAPWLNQNWLAQLVLFGVWELGGLNGLIVLNTLLFTAGFAILFRLCASRAGGIRPAAIASAVLLLPVVFNTAVRPQSFSWLLMAVVLLILEESQRRPRLAILLPGIFALWANLHGAFVVAFGFLAIELIAAFPGGRRKPELNRRGRLLLVAGTLSALAALVNPWGWRVYGYVLDIGADPTIRGAIDEWQPPSLTETAGALFFVSALILVGAIALSPSRLGMRDLLRLAFGFVLGLLAIRNGLWWAFAAAPALATLLAPLGRRMRSVGDAPSFVNAIFVAAAMVLVLLSSPWLRSGSPLIPDQYRSLVATGTPLGATSYLSRHDFSGNMLNAQRFGSFFEFALPEHRTFIDSRIEMFPPQLWSDYTTLMAADPGWTGLVEKYGIGYAVLAMEPRAPLADAFESSGEWKLVFSDDIAAIYVRSDG